MIWAASAFALLCLASLSHAAPSLSCDEVLRPLEQIDVGELEGTWAIIGGNSNFSRVTDELKRRDSITLRFSNFSFTHQNRVGQLCDGGGGSNLTQEGAKLALRSQGVNLIVTFFQTSRADTALFRYELQFPHISIMDIYLASKRREVEQIDLRRLETALACLQLPDPVMFDAGKELCPEEVSSQGTRA